MIKAKDNLRELPNAWRWTRLGNVSLIGAGSPAPQGQEFFENGTHPFVRVQDMGNLGDAVYLKKTRDYVNDKAINRLKKFPSGSVLFTKSGMSILLNQRAILARDMFIVSHIGVSMPLGTIPSKFVYYWLKTIDFKGLTHATTLPSLRLSKVEAISFPLPPLAEQKRIVAKIEELFTKLDAGIEALKKIKQQLKRYRQAVLKHAFEGKLTEKWRQAHKSELEPASKLLERIAKEREKTTKGKTKKLPSLDATNLPALPDRWVYATLPLLVKQEKHAIKRGPFGSAIKKEYFVPSGYKVYQQKNAIYNDFTLGDYYINEKKFNELKAFEVKSGDFIVSCSGTIGKIAVAPKDMQRGVINQALLKITLNNNVILTKYFINLFSSFVLQQEILSKTRGSAMMNISSVEAVKQIPFALAPLPEQQQIVQEIERHFSIADQIEQTIEQGLKQSGRLRQSIFKKAFEGKLVPQDPEDEPAEKLLERIKVEKESYSRSRRT